MVMLGSCAGVPKDIGPGVPHPEIVVPAMRSTKIVSIQPLRKRLERRGMKSSKRPASEVNLTLAESVLL